MADQDRRNDPMDESARDAGSKRGSASNDPSRQRNDSSMGEQDDVAEDRNLSGASTWLNLPDQPKDDADSRSNDESNDQGDRPSKR